MEIDSLKTSIRKHEGLNLKPYKCPDGRLTIGFGRNLEQNGISIKEAEALLQNDLFNLKLELEDKLPFFSKLSDIRQNVLIEMAYQMGVPKLLGFQNTLQYLSNALECREYENWSGFNEWNIKASKEILNSKWHRQMITYDAMDGAIGENGLLRSEYLSKVMREGKY